MSSLSTALRIQSKDSEKINYDSFPSSSQPNEHERLSVKDDDHDNPLPSHNYKDNNARPPRNDVFLELSDSIRNQRRLHYRGNPHGSRQGLGSGVKRDSKFVNDDKHDDNAFLGAYEFAVTTSVLIYWIFVSLIPVYNKFFFQKSLFPYPVATAGIQLGVVSLMLALISTLQQFCCWPLNLGTLQRQRQDDAEYQVLQQQPQVQRSWILGPHLFWKVKWCFPIGFLFGVKYGVTNLGLHLVSAPTHLLLQSTDLVWTVLGAWLINGEVINGVELLCLMGCVSGSLILGWQVSADETVSAPLLAILINLISPMLLGLCIATLRLACVELMRPDNRVGGTVSSVELTSIKLLMSSLVALVLASIWEGGRAATPSWKNEGQHVPWWTAFSSLPKSTKWGVMGGAGLIAVFQANCTFLTFLTNAVTVGLCGQVKIIPQWITAVIFTTKVSNFTVKPTAIVGAFLICGSAATFAYSNWREWKEESEADKTLLVVSEDEPNEELVPILPSNTSRSVMEKMSSCGATRSTDGKHPNNHHPPYLYADGDQWGDASMKSSFTETTVAHGMTFMSALTTTPSISSKGNLVICEPPTRKKFSTSGSLSENEPII
jgi:hypothetical protein